MAKFHPLIESIYRSKSYKVQREDFVGRKATITAFLYLKRKVNYCIVLFKKQELKSL